jgi:hypothetical protein
MEIRCKNSKRFLMNVNIESYVSNLRKLGVSLELPLVIEIPCRCCRTIEVYEIYETHYKLVRSYKK